MKPSYLIFPGPVTLALLLLLLLLAAGLLVAVDDVNLPEVAHGELQQRVLAVVGHLASRHTHRVRHCVPVVTPAVESWQYSSSFVNVKRRSSQQIKQENSK